MDSADLPQISKYFEYFLTYTIQLYVFCHFGDELTGRFIDLNKKIYEQDWHLYPLKLQKNFRVMMMVTQNPVYIRGFASIKCTHESYKKVFVDRINISLN